MSEEHTAEYEMKRYRDGLFNALDDLNILHEMIFEAFKNEDLKSKYINDIVGKLHKPPEWMNPEEGVMI